MPDKLFRDYYNEKTEVSAITINSKLLVQSGANEPDKMDVNLFSGSGGYTGTAQDLKDEIDSVNFDGVRVYQTLAQAQAVLPVPPDFTGFSVDPLTDPLNAGQYYYLASEPNGTKFYRDFFKSEDYIEKINLANPDFFVNKFISNVDGTISNSANWLSWESPIGYITEGVQLTISGYDTYNDVNARYAIYDSGNNLIGSVVLATDNGNPVTFTTPVGASKLFVQIENEVGINPNDNRFLTTFQIQLGSEATDFVSFNGQIKESAIPKSVKNIPTGNFIQKESDTKIWMHIKLHDDTYLRILMIRLISGTDFFDIWGLRTANIAFLNDGSFTVSKQVIQSGIWETAIGVSGFPDAFLGMSHSCEKFIDYSILINGSFIDVSSLVVGEFLETEEITFVQRSKLLPADGTGYTNDIIDSTNALAQVRRKWLFKGNELYLDQYFDWVNTLAYGDAAYTTMLPIYRINQASEQITTDAVRNDEYQLYNVSTQGFINNLNTRINDATNILIAGSEFSAEMDVLEVNPRNANAGVWVQDTLAYNKLYSQIGAGNTNIGDKWVMKSIYRFNFKKQ